MRPSVRYFIASECARNDIVYIMYYRYYTGRDTTGIETVLSIICGKKDTVIIANSFVVGPIRMGSNDQNKHFDRNLLGLIRITNTPKVQYINKNGTPL